RGRRGKVCGNVRTRTRVQYPLRKLSVCLRRANTWPVQRTAGVCAGVLAVLDGHGAVDDDRVDADGKLVRLVVGRAVADGLRIENDDVGEVAVFQETAIGDLQLFRRKAGHLPD